MGHTWTTYPQSPLILLCFGDQHLIIGDHFVSHGRQKATSKKIELGALESCHKVSTKLILVGWPGFSTQDFNPFSTKSDQH